MTRFAVPVRRSSSVTRYSAVWLMNRAVPLIEASIGSRRKAPRDPFNTIAHGEFVDLFQVLKSGEIS
ncbi:MAG: hypothetical protein MZU84_06195 [Sphingobacterium sp.]|nr:hypothetical protein [Sphingobacterium sp.]